MKSLAQRSAGSAFRPLMAVTEPVADRVRSAVDRMTARGNMGVSENEFEHELELSREVFILYLRTPEALQ